MVASLNALSTDNSNARRVEHILESLNSRDTIDALEFYRTCKRTNPLLPEQELQLAVLTEAVSDLTKFAEVRSQKQKLASSGAKEWILDDDPHWLFSFMSICESLGLSPSYLRKGLQGFLREAI